MFASLFAVCLFTFALLWDWVNEKELNTDSGGWRLWILLDVLTAGSIIQLPFMNCIHPLLWVPHGRRHLISKENSRSPGVAGFRLMAAENRGYFHGRALAGCNRHTHGTDVCTYIHYTCECVLFMHAPRRVTQGSLWVSFYLRMTKYNFLHSW